MIRLDTAVHEYWYRLVTFDDIVDNDPDKKVCELVALVMLCCPFLRRSTDCTFRRKFGYEDSDVVLPFFLRDFLLDFPRFVRSRRGHKEQAIHNPVNKSSPLAPQNGAISLHPSGKRIRVSSPSPIVLPSP
mmetsp:Transcript_8412/g.20949  ORF Transcript_8412/g.20949 Transcript_8412/m.20949 type:complete len:131 (-) Transcript_8412:1558-1950(-)